MPKEKTAPVNLDKIPAEEICASRTAAAAKKEMPATELCASRATAAAKTEAELIALRAQAKKQFYQKGDNRAQIPSLLNLFKNFFDNKPLSPVDLLAIHRKIKENDPAFLQVFDTPEKIVKFACYSLSSANVVLESTYLKILLNSEQLKTINDSKQTIDSLANEKALRFFQITELVEQLTPSVETPKPTSSGKVTHISEFRVKYSLDTPEATKRELITELFPALTAEHSKLFALLEHIYYYSTTREQLETLKPEEKKSATKAQEDAFFAEVFNKPRFFKLLYSIYHEFNKATATFNSLPSIKSSADWKNTNLYHEFIRFFVQRDTLTTLIQPLDWIRLFVKAVDHNHINFNLWTLFSEEMVRISDEAKKYQDSINEQTSAYLDILKGQLDLVNAQNITQRLEEETAFYEKLTYLARIGASREAPKSPHRNQSSVFLLSHLRSVINLINKATVPFCDASSLIKNKQLESEHAKKIAAAKQQLYKIVDDVIVMKCKALILELQDPKKLDWIPTEIPLIQQLIKLAPQPETQNLLLTTLQSACNQLKQTYDIDTYSMRPSKVRPFSYLLEKMNTQQSHKNPKGQSLTAILYRLSQELDASGKARYSNEQLRNPIDPANPNCIIGGDYAELSRHAYWSSIAKMVVFFFLLTPFSLYFTWPAFQKARKNRMAERSVSELEYQEITAFRKSLKQPAPAAANLAPSHAIAGSLPPPRLSPACEAIEPSAAPAAASLSLFNKTGELRKLKLTCTVTAKATKRRVGAEQSQSQTLKLMMSTEQAERFDLLREAARQNRSITLNDEAKKALRDKILASKENSKENISEVLAQIPDYNTAANKKCPHVPAELTAPSSASRPVR